MTCQDLIRPLNVFIRGTMYDALMIASGRTDQLILTRFFVTLSILARV